MIHPFFSFENNNLPRAEQHIIHKQNNVLVLTINWRTKL
jgi:hypothetical protein